LGIFDEHMDDIGMKEYGACPFGESTLVAFRKPFCREHGIRLSGLALGKPPKDRKLSRQTKEQPFDCSFT